MDSNRLIYGKAGLDRIVSIEIEDETATLFRELEDGSLDIKKVSNRFWILATKPFGTGWVRLEGEQDFKWGKQFKQYKDWAEAKKSLPYQEIYSISNAKEQFQVKDGYCYYQGMKHTEPSILSFDIETTGLDRNEDSKVILISNTFRKLGKITRRLFSYEDYDNCAEMIEDWSKWVREIDPSVMCFHNGYAYDLPYLQFCYNKYTEGNIRLGRLDKPLYFNKFESKYRIDGSRDLHYHKCQVYGRELVDTMFLAYKYDAVEKKYESYRLKSIIAVEGLEKKDRVFYDADKIRHNYKDQEEFAKIKEYCKDDSDDALALYDLMVAPTFYLTQSIPKPFQLVVESATGSQINSLLVRAYLQDKHSVAKADNLDEEKVEGGISFAVPGIYNNVFKVDIKSCYPSQILRFKLYEERKDPKAYYYKLVEHFTLQRFEYKKQMLATGDNYWKNLDAMAKIFINSSYGVANTSGLNYNSAAIARKITLESRAIIDMSLRWASGFGYNHWATRFYDAVGEKEADRVYLSLPEQELPIKYQHDFIIAPSDTDSISFCKVDMSPFTPEEIKTLLGEINEQSPDKVLWEDDGVYKTIIALKAKNYVLYSPEAKKPLKIKGSALKGSTRPEAIKELIKKFIETMAYIENREAMMEELQSLYNKYVAEAMTVTEIKRWSARKTLSSTMVESDRKNETRVMDAIKGSNYREGDRFHVYKLPDESLKLSEHFDGVYDKSHLLKNLYNTVEIFSYVLPVKTLFPNYSLKKNFKILLDKYPENQVS
jgi:DNA polymerase elongation subunit (family B)